MECYIRRKVRQPGHELVELDLTVFWVQLEDEGLVSTLLEDMNRAFVDGWF